MLALWRFFTRSFKRSTVSVLQALCKGQQNNKSSTNCSKTGSVGRFGFYKFSHSEKEALALWQMHRRLHTDKTFPIKCIGKSELTDWVNRHKENAFAKSMKDGINNKFAIHMCEDWQPVVNADVLLHSLLVKQKKLCGVFVRNNNFWLQKGIKNRYDTINCFLFQWMWMEDFNVILEELPEAWLPSWALHHIYGVSTMKFAPQPTVMSTCVACVYNVYVGCMHVEWAQHFFWLRHWMQHCSVESFSGGEPFTWDPTAAPGRCKTHATHPNSVVCNRCGFLHLHAFPRLNRCRMRRDELKHSTLLCPNLMHGTWT